MASQSSAVGNTAPARYASQPEGDQVNDFLQNFGQRTRSVEVFEDPAATLFDLGQAVIERGLGLNARGQRSSLATDLAFQGPSLDANGEDDDKQKSNHDQQVPDAKPGRVGHHRYVVIRTHK